MEKAVLKWEAIIEITVFDLKGNVTEYTRFRNAIHNVGLNMLRDLLEGAINDGEIKDLAVGESNAAIDVADTTLTNESFRKQMTTTTPGATGILVNEVYIAPAQAVFTIEELGWFAGVDADGGADHGIMISRVLYHKEKTNLESLMVKRTDTITEV